jgi:hypothetical protein
MYFENVHRVGGAASKAARMNPGIGFAFFQENTAPNFPIEKLFSYSRRVSNDDNRTIRQYLDLSVRGVEKSYRYQSSKYLWEGVRNEEIVQYILNSNIVMERSPPYWEMLKSLISKSPGIGIGTFVGFELSGSIPELMIITVPVGILVVSSAIGVSKALERGLNKKVEHLLK